MTVLQITKHRLHWLLGLIERKASLVQSASACLCRNGHLCPTSPHQGKGAKKPLCRRPLNSALNHTLGRLLSDKATEQTDDLEKKKKTPTPPCSMRETTGEIIHEDGWKFSRAIDALLRLVGTRSEGLWNTCRLESGKRTKPLLLLPHNFAQFSEFCGLALIREQHLAYWAFCRHQLWATQFQDNVAYD